MAGRFPLLLDEHIPLALAQALRGLGWTVSRGVELPDLGAGADDEEILAYAAQHGCVVLSSDEAALRWLRQYRQQGAPFPGMVCWPQKQRAVMTIGEAVEDLEQLAGEHDPFVYGYRFIQPSPR